nr:efflux RND transporter permease subunit [Rhodoblastus sphagnicola]
MSDWALNRRSLIWYFMIVFVIAGAFAYLGLGREEDPNFTIKTMIVQANWPGATAEEVTHQVTERIERKMEELESLDFTRSITTAGNTIVFVNLLDTTKAKDVESIWARVRNMVADIKADFPSGVQGPFFNDRFGDVYGNIFAFTADGLTHRQLRDQVEDARAKILTTPNVGRVDLIGAQDEAVYLEFSTRQVAALGVDMQQIMTTLAAQNAVTPSGAVQAGPEQIFVRVSGQFTSEDDLRAINLRVNDRFFRLSDIASIKRGYVDPPSNLFRYNGQPAIGLAIGMKAGANLLEFGAALDKELDKIKADLPIGADVFRVSDQPKVVEEAVSGFTRGLIEAVIIVLGISFISLGWRAGLVVAIAIPLVLAITFLVMRETHISLQRISLGALIIALGLLVDDAMIAVEMMVARLELGDSLRKAATYVYTSTAFPMLTGTLVTVASFIPVGLNDSAAGEFTFTLFVVIAVALVVSWLVAVLFTPLLGVTLLPKTMKGHHETGKGFIVRAFERALEFCMNRRWLTIGATLGVFACAIVGMGFVQQQFFPSSDRPELIVDWNLPQNSSIYETDAQIKRFEAEMLAGEPDIALYSSYIGEGAKRFVLAFDVQPANAAFGQTVILTKNLEARDRLIGKYADWLRQTFPGTDAFIHLLDIGPPVGRPVQYRLSGPDIQGVREKSRELANIVAKNPNLGIVTFDWGEPARVVKVNVLQDKARALGVSSQDIASALNSVVNGATVTQIRDDIYLVDVVARARGGERASVDTLQNLQLPGTGGQAVPLAAVASVDFALEQPTIWRRARLPTVTLKIGVNGDIQPATVVQQLAGDVLKFTESLPPSYKVEVGGAVEESGKSQGPINAVFPVMLLVMATILMIQLQSFNRLFLVFAVAPLAVIGVSIALLASHKPMGFVAILGILALIGILIRNSVILIIQIETLLKEGVAAWDAVREATQHRMRPIMLTAAAATLALIPISREIFWGPMAYAMMGGIIVGTVLTLLFLPALYLAWFRIPRPEPDSGAPAGETSRDPRFGPVGA